MQTSDPKGTPSGTHPPKPGSSPSTREHKPHINISAFVTTFPIEFKIFRQELRGGQVVNYWYALVPVEANPILNIGDPVELLIQVPGGLTVKMTGTIIAKYRYHYQVYLRRTAREVVEYIMNSGLPAVVLDIRRTQKQKRRVER
jgi:hypothetical protein